VANNIILNRGSCEARSEEAVLGSYQQTLNFLQYYMQKVLSLFLRQQRNCHFARQQLVAGTNFLGRSTLSGEVAESI